MKRKSKKLLDLLKTKHIAVYFSKAMALECALLLARFVNGVPLKPSPEQKNAIEKFGQGWDVVVNACAGSGKTTALLMVIATYIKEIIPSITVHSLAYQALINHFGNIFKVDEDKMEKRVKAFVNARTDDPERQAHFLGKLQYFFEQARSTYCPPKYNIGQVIKHVAADRSVYIWIDENREEKLRNLLKPFTDDELTELWQGLTTTTPNHWGQTVIDYEDMIYMYHAHNVKPIKTYETIFVDEAQDLRRHYFKILRDHADRFTKWYMVGDTKQSIMGWNGVASTQFEENASHLQKAMINPVTGKVRYLDFTVSFRNNNSNHEALEYMLKENAEAYLSKHKVHREDEGHFEIVKGLDFKNMRMSNAMIIARYRYQLLPMYIKAVKEGLNPILSGFDFYKELERLKGYGWYLTQGDDQEYTAAQLILVGINGRIANRKAILEVLESAQWMTKMRLDAEIEFLEALKIQVTYLFSRLNDKVKKKLTSLLRVLKNQIESAPNKVYLCSAHASKGKEAEYVYILDVDKFFDVRASTPEQVIQELNLIYVACTRSKKKTVGVLASE